jgi:pimeloyl-ACP methyl ester carboxylesterase
VGLWGINQAGWIIPYAMRERPGADLVILVSPAGVNPYEQVAFFLQRQARGWGLGEAEAARADSMHRASSLYYAGTRSHDEAQAVVDRYRGEPWFERVVTHPYWDEMTSDGRLLTPSDLAAALAARPGDFEIYRSASSFLDYGAVYQELSVPTLVIYGADDALVPVARSRDVIEPALRRPGAAYQVRVFEDADHDMEAPDGKVRPDYLSFMVAWVRSRVGAN